MEKSMVEQTVRDVLRELFSEAAASASLTAAPPAPASVPSVAKNSFPLLASEIASPAASAVEEELVDICSPAVRRRILIANPANVEMMERMRHLTTARIGAGRSGTRLNTVTMLTLRANHATARDSVFQEVDERFLDEMGLFTVQTQCSDKNIYLTRPDLGRKLSEEGRKTVTEKCKHAPRVQLYVSDGLSSKAIEANVRDIFPAICAGLQGYGIDFGTPFFVKFGRVGVMDEISDLLDAEVTCVLIGERPGLSTAESMSAYLAYRATVGMPEARRTVVSNIHNEGINAVEAGAYIADIIRTLLEKKASGVELSL